MRNDFKDVWEAAEEGGGGGGEAEALGETGEEVEREVGSGVGED